MAQDFKPISQRKWSKGLQATYSLFAEPDGLFKRISNLLYDRRGGARVVDGSLIFTKQNGALQANAGPILDAVLYQPTTGTAPYYMGLSQGGTVQIAAVAGLSATAVELAGAVVSIARTNGVTTVTLDGASVDLVADSQYPQAGATVGFLAGSIVISGTVAFNRTFDASIMTFVGPSAGGADFIFSYADPGSDATETAGAYALATPLAAGNYIFDVTASDSAGGETTGTGAPVTVALAAPSTAIRVSWTGNALAAGYNLYVASTAASGRVNTNTSTLIPTSNGSSVANPGFGYLGQVNTPGAVAPVANTTSVRAVILWRFDVPNYTVQLAALPPAPVIAVIPPPGGGTGSGAVPAGQNPNATPQGGVLGELSPTPQIVPFQGVEILALGNGYAPQFYQDGSTLQPIPNTFTAVYPDWVASSLYNVGDNIVDSVSGGVFTATQGGESGTTRPAFNNTINAGTADNTVVWECTATNFSGQPLRGAAHAVVYGNSLWLANTNPTSTADNQDGPSCIKASDVGDFKSWNPVNVAMVSKDDGDQITAIATFTVAQIGIEPTGNLIVFKNFATYQVVGVFGANDFAIQAAQTDMGCVASRSVQFLSGYGAVARLTHLGFALFDGVGDKLFSEEIRPYLFGDKNQPDIVPCDWSYIYFSKASQCSNPPMYLCACPLLASPLTGVTVAGGTVGTAFTVYVKVTQLVDIGNGEFAEEAITNEFEVQSGNQSVKVTTPAAKNGVQYRVYAGFSSGAEDVYAQAVSYNAQNILLSSMVAGSPSLGAGALTRVFCYDLVQKCWTIVDLPFPISVIKEIRTGGTQTLTIVGGWNDGALRRTFAGDTTWDGAPIEWNMTAGEVYQGGGSGKVFFRKIVVRGSTQDGVTLMMQVAVQGKPGTTITAPQTSLGPSQFDARMDVMQQGENANVTLAGSGQCTIDSVDWYVKPKSAGAPVSAQR